MPNGTLRPDHIEAYKFLGDYIRTCYGQPIAHTSVTAASGTLSFPETDVDRFVLTEDQAAGQKVRSFSLSANGKVLYSGTSIGHKHIALLPQRVRLSLVAINITAVAATNVTVAAFNCTSTVPAPTSCNAVQGKMFDGPVASTIHGLDVDTCCDACRWVLPSVSWCSQTPAIALLSVP